LFNSIKAGWCACLAPGNASDGRVQGQAL